VMYSSSELVGRASVTVTWKSSTRADDLTHRSTVAGPTIVMAWRNGGVSKAMPSGVGTVVQSHGGSAAHGLSAAGRSVSGRAAGSRISDALPDDEGTAVVSDPPVVRW